MLNLHYDKKYDILNIIVDDSSNAVGCEEYDGLVVMRDYGTNVITGLMLYNFLDKYERHCVPHFPDELDIVIERDIMPAILPK